MGDCPQLPAQGATPQFPDDPAVRDTRLALLKAVNDLLARFADFRLVATEGPGK